MIKVFVQKTMAKADIDTPLTSGSVGLEVEFVFSEDWSGLTKTAVFETSSFYKETAPLSTASTIVPADVMAWEDETLYIGVYGTAQNGEIVIPTVYANCGRIHKGANDSEGGRPLIPAQSDILQNQIDSLGGRVAWLEATGGGGGGAGVLLDTTLTQSGMAADAKAVGDALSELEGKIPEGGGSADLTGYATEEWVEKGYQPKGNYATKSEIPTVPTKLSAFTNDAGFVTEDALENLGGKAYVQNTQPANMEEGEFWYNPDEEPEGGESSGSGGGGERIVADGTKIATGTVPNGAAAWSGGEFGVTVADLKKWKKFRIVANLGSTSCFHIGLPSGKGYIFNNTAWDNQKHFYDLEWIDSDRTILGGYFFAGNAYNNPAVQTHVATGNSDGGSFSPIAASIPLTFRTLDSSKDEMAVRYIINKAQSAEGTWSIFGILRYEEG